MIGYIGLIILCLAYVLLITKYNKWFIPVDALASFILTIHAINLQDIPFTIVNGFITIILIIKYLKKERI